MEQLELPKISHINARLLASSIEISENEAEEITYQHTVLCQTCLPYRDPGDSIRNWEREQGRVALRVNAGEIHDPNTNKWIELGLPFGPKPRLVLMHLNAEAIKTQSPIIEVEESLTGFVKRIGLSAQGRDIRTVKNQLARLSSATIRMAVEFDDRAAQLNGQIVDSFDLWFPKDEKQRVLWPSTIELNDKYFQSLVSHAVPLNEKAIAALSHSAMALDIYTWLAQRLHRIDPKKPQAITWKALKDQFGWNYKRMNNFRAVFIKALQQVHSQYRDAKLDTNPKGMVLWHSPPPIKKRLFTVKALPSK